MKRNRFLYFIAGCVVVPLALASRQYASLLPDILKKNTGDALWSVMAFSADHLGKIQPSMMGYGFMWSDLVCYTIGVIVAAGVELITVAVIKSKTRVR